MKVEIFNARSSIIACLRYGNFEPEVKAKLFKVVEELNYSLMFDPPQKNPQPLSPEEIILLARLEIGPSVRSLPDVFDSNETGAAIYQALNKLQEKTQP